LRIIIFAQPQNMTIQTQKTLYSDKMKIFKVQNVVCLYEHLSGEFCVADFDVAKNA
jgi:hypothetical protein